MLTKSEIITILRDIATLLELTDENPFKTRAYLNAAFALEGTTEDIMDLIETKKLAELPGFGEDITEKVTTLATKGKLPYYEGLKKKVPPGLVEMSRIPGLGPKKIKTLHEKLNIKTLQELEKACQKNKIATLSGFGEKTQQNILNGLQHLTKYATRHLYNEAWEAAQDIVAQLKKKSEVKQCEIGGSLRRHRETIGDIDLLISTTKPNQVMKHFIRLPQVEMIIMHGPTKSSVRLKGSKIQVDLRAVTEEEFPFALHYFTGNQDHNIKIRARARSKGYKLNEYGLFKGKRKIHCKDETELFKRLGLAYIPPELRESWGEIEAAEKNKIPDLIKVENIRGVFHVHSNWSDGKAELEEMIAAAQDLGFEYLGISEHSQSARYARGLDLVRLKQQETEIHKLQKKYKIHIFWGIESDILADGSLDYPQAHLERFDFVIASIHSRMKMAEKEMTERIITALKNPFTTMLGHPTGRLLLEREPYAVNMKEVINTAADYGKIIELNAHPKRLDLDWHWGPYVKEKGVKISINPDAHSVKGLSDFRYGVGIARKGWFEKKDVINTYSKTQVMKFLKKEFVYA